MAREPMPGERVRITQTGGALDGETGILERFANSDFAIIRIDGRSRQDVRSRERVYRYDLVPLSEDGIAIGDTIEILDRRPRQGLVGMSPRELFGAEATVMNFRRRTGEATRYLICAPDADRRMWLDAGNVKLIPQSEEEPAEGIRRVLVSRPGSAELCYGLDFEAAIGDVVLCPPTPKEPGIWREGRIESFGSSGYSGKVKLVAPMDRSRKTFRRVPTDRAAAIRGLRAEQADIETKAAEHGWTPGLTQRVRELSEQVDQLSGIPERDGDEEFWAWPEVPGE